MDGGRSDRFEAVGRSPNWRRRAARVTSWAALVLPLLATVYLVVGWYWWRPLLVGDANFGCTNSYRAPSDYVAFPCFIVSACFFVWSISEFMRGERANGVRLVIAGSLLVVLSFLILGVSSATDVNYCG